VEVGSGSLGGLGFMHLGSRGRCPRKRPRVEEIAIDPSRYRSVGPREEVDYLDEKRYPRKTSRHLKKTPNAFSRHEKEI